jgi:hypothetical protein
MISEIWTTIFLESLILALMLPRQFHQSRPMKFSMVFEHLFPSVIGMIRTLLQQPFFALHLLAVRASFFFTRRLDKPVSTPDGFLIETTGELISYWSFFIEREGCVQDWLEPLSRET